MGVQQYNFFKSQYINAANTLYLFIASLSNFKIILVFFRDKTYCIKINTAYITSKDVTNDSMCYTQKHRKFAPVYSHICSHVAWCIVKRKKIYIKEGIWKWKLKNLYTMKKRIANKKTTNMKTQLVVSVDFFCIFIFDLSAIN